MLVVLLREEVLCAAVQGGFSCESPEAPTGILWSVALERSVLVLHHGNLIICALHKHLGDSRQVVNLCKFFSSRSEEHVAGVGLPKEPVVVICEVL